MAAMNGFKVIDTFHTGICVEDLDFNIGFFTQVLGYGLIDRAPRDPKNQSFITGVPGAEVEVAYLQGPGHRVELLCYSGPADRKSYQPRMVDAGHFHLALVVDDVEAAAARSMAYDQRITTLSPTYMEVDQGPNKGNRIIFIKLPGGLIIEFTTQKSRN
jgi:catechol 2,3-dioxygenase-like lactoylglutathione lyase family enzyme